MEKSKIYSLALGILLLSSLTVVSAEITLVDDEYNFFTDFMHTLQDLGLFSASGENRQCASQPTYTTTVDGYIAKSTLLDNAGCSSDVALLNIFDTDWHYLAEYKTEIIGTGLTTPAPRIIEVYCCPYPACDSDSDCSIYPASNFGDICNTAYGACYSTAPTYLTQILKCENDKWMQYGTASFGEERYCNDDNENTYIDKNGGEHCVLPTYSSVNDGSWCGTEKRSEGESCYPPYECQTGLTCANFQCVDLTSFVCGDGICQYTETQTSCPSDCTDAPVCGDGNCEAGETSGATYDCPADCKDIKLSAVIYDVQLFKDTFKSAEEVEVRFRVKNTGDTGDYLIEAGIIPKSVAEDWGFNYEGQELFSIFDWLTTTSTECCVGQQNIFAKTTNLKTDEINEVSIKIPNAPYSDIRDLCYDNNYWDGEGEYVLYVTMKTGCYPDGEEVTYETIILNINDSITPIIDNDTITPAVSMTWTEFYSMSDDEFSKKAKRLGCNSATDCPSKKGYTITCEDNEQFSNRLYEASVDSCDDNFGIIDELLTIISLGVGSGSYCEGVVRQWDGVTSFLQWIGLKAEAPKGYCIAESSTWYGSAWDSALKAMGGMGLPYQYVMIITIILLITLFGFVMKAVTG